MAVERVAPPDRADNASRVRIEQQLVRIETMAFLGSIGAMHAVAVQKTRPRLGQISVPDHVRSFLQRQPLELPSAARIEHDEVYGGRMRGIKREVDTLAIPRRAERIRASRPRDCGRGHARAPSSSVPARTLHRFNASAPYAIPRAFPAHAGATSVRAIRPLFSGRRFRTPARNQAQWQRARSESFVG